MSSLSNRRWAMKNSIMTSILVRIRICPYNHSSSSRPLRAPPQPFTRLIHSSKWMEYLRKIGRYSRWLIRDSHQGQPLSRTSTQICQLMGEPRNRIRKAHGSAIQCRKIMRMVFNSLRCTIMTLTSSILTMKVLSRNRLKSLNTNNKINILRRILPRVKRRH